MTTTESESSKTGRFVTARSAARTGRRFTHANRVTAAKAYVAASRATGDPVPDRIRKLANEHS